MHIAKFLRRITSGPARPDIPDPLDIADKIDGMFGVRYSELEAARRKIDARIGLEDEWAMLGGIASNLDCVALIQRGRYDYVSDTRPPRLESVNEFIWREENAKRKASAMIDRYGSEMKMVEDETADEFNKRVIDEKIYMNEKFGQFGDIAFGVGTDGVRASPYPLVPPANVLTDGVMSPAPNVASTLIDPEEEMPSLAAILAEDVATVARGLETPTHLVTVHHDDDAQGGFTLDCYSRGEAEEYVRGVMRAGGAYRYVSIRRLV